jgi:hypothetical protein
MLQNSKYLPRNFRSKIKQKKKNQIMLPTPQEAGPSLLWVKDFHSFYLHHYLLYGVFSKEVRWMKDFLSVKDDWEVTTGTLTIILGASGEVKGQRIEESLNTRSESRGTITDEGDPDSDLMPKAADMTGDFTTTSDGGLMLGKTVPNRALSDQQKFTEIVDLQSKRGLIIIVDQIVVKKGAKVTINPLKVPTDVIEENLIHEIAAHAGLFSQKEPAEHGTGRVNDNLSEILRKTNTSASKSNLVHAVKAYIDAMRKP